MKRFDGRVVIVTGATGGVGYSVVRAFAQEGAKVVAVARNAQKGDETATRMREMGWEVVFIAADISRASDVDGLMKKATECFGKIDTLVNTAAVLLPEDTTVVDCDEAAYDQTMAINLKGTWLTMKYAIPEMIKGGGGTIVNFSSGAGYYAHPTMSIYSATKAAVNHLSRCAAVQYAANNVRVNVVAPGPVATPMMDFWSSDTKAHFLRETPDGRMAKPEEVAELVLYLASDKSSHITAQVVYIDGGFSVMRSMG